MKSLQTKYFKLFSLILLILVLTTPFILSQLPGVFAAGITLSETTQAVFPTSITFTVKAQSDVNIVKLRLLYKVKKENYADVVSEGWPVFEPGTSVTTQWLWDMRKSSLPPGTVVEYWWTARDANGNTATTKPVTLTYTDTRYKWQSIENDPITLYWYSGSTNFANALMTAALEGLQRIENNTGAVPQRKVSIFIYASSQELQGSLLFPQGWEGGVTFTSFDIIAIGVSPSQLSYGQRAVPHELTHWIVGQLTDNNYGAGLPTWLEEGFATYGEGVLSPDYQNALNNAIKNNQLISVRSLSSPFSAIAQQAYISYGESNSIVTLLIEKYGKEKMVQLLNTFREGSSYDNALKKVYGFDQDGLESLWRQFLGISTTR